MTAELDIVQDSAENIAWRKTTYIRPHEYFMREDFPDLYDQLKRAVADHGYEGYFYHTPFRYLNLGAYKYWVYDTLINRERLDLVHPTKAQSESQQNT
jgi:hypothetical protein